MSEQNRTGITEPPANTPDEQPVELQREAPEEPSAEQLATTPVEPHKTKGPPRQKRGGWFTKLLLLMGLLGGVVYWWQSSYQPTVQATQSRIADLSAEVHALKSQLENLSGVQTQINSTITEIQGQQATLTEAVQNLASRKPQGSEDWVLAEAQYLLLVAEQRLNLERDAATALAAMEAADGRLRSLGRPDLKPVRERIVKDMNDLRAVPAVDVAGLSLYLADLAERVDTLPMKGGEIVEKPALPSQPPADKSNISSWRDFAQAVWKDVLGLVSVTEQGLKDPSLFDPKFRYMLQQYLRLELASARLALLRRDTKNLRASLETVTNLLNKHYDTQSEFVQEVLKKLEQMRAEELNPPLPSIGQSLRAIREYATTQNLRLDESGKTEAPPEGQQTEGAVPMQVIQPEEQAPAASESPPAPDKAVPSQPAEPETAPTPAAGPSGQSKGAKGSPPPEAAPAEPGATGGPQP